MCKTGTIGKGPRILGIHINPKRLQAQLFHGRLAETISQLNIADPEETSIFNKIARNQPVVGTATNDRLPVGSTHPMPAIKLMLLKIELRKRTTVPVAEDLIAKRPEERRAGKECVSKCKSRG